MQGCHGLAQDNLCHRNIYKKHGSAIFHGASADVGKLSASK
jgi:hypothetical protein